eukprot:TCALIF_12013-PA protein Name:"Similar to Tf2-11 Transposon Tf2-11 polyprotein (Schizosaccharomyces pombe (strain 972 / ATCC 24843))" AED:0.11 eAED:0.11 QI:0/0/0/0.5/1/1/2/0/266
MKHFPWMMKKKKGIDEDVSPVVMNSDYCHGINILDKDEMRSRPSKKHWIVDALSRGPLFDPSSNASDVEDEPFVNNVQVCQITGELDQNLGFMSRADIEDPLYEEVDQTLLQGKDLRALPSSHTALAYKNYWDGLSYDEDYRVILYNARVVVPLAARKTILVVLHQSHQGVRKIRAAARVRCFWPGMSNEIPLQIQNCRLCQKIRSTQPMETIQKSESSRPFESISVDPFQAAGKEYMVLVDRFSNWLAVLALKALDTKALTRHLL